ncbi:MAG: hypothetical protein B0D96_03705 [Candidatus Sedimenticola endophacoides]|uniref:LysM domain-containing protein n=1 Tax=Candidatus Sedimenticola endophacoides TaxID=2548426 RepID=A0A657Q0E7_9GAMM|nr:MAG: hypothetical protein B0D94_04110 [Candidatus Sedimenticola endophacoides]OQX36664.1 MAG: hypothetical protein B0D96_03705 [Candidatus Sedimenticola endophacoides]OQX40977.1 MAG: hypothetical protein B0D89_05600 [Candidatus Sedimenticola endophacoides]OQX42760.1 MAG: hypothetical protein B0D82_00495 [Candidatus Sedimenticola endophacoides]OQX43392.1 MAG: hypothetical protein B0D88_04545 [Candidatus Sedimenticola endophacoides]
MSGKATFPLLLVLMVATTLELSGCGSPPRRAPVVSRERAPAVPVAPARSGYHRVRRGDTLFSIAWRYGLEYRQLAAWNGIRAPYIIYPGQRLRLAAGSARPASKPARSSASAPRRTGALRPGQPRETTPSGSGKTDYPEKPKTIKSTKALKLQWLWPTQGTLLERFDPSDVTRKGIKIGGSAGQAVKAAEAGDVVYAGSGLLGYGRLIIIKHNQNYLSAYGHNRKLLVKEGDRVAKGARIAEMGSKGTGGAMLHFEIRRNGVPMDPLKVVRPSS